MSCIAGLNMIASENAARNILVAGGHAEIKDRPVGQHKTTAKVAVAAACDVYTCREATDRLLPRVFRSRRMSMLYAFQDFRSYQHI